MLQFMDDTNVFFPSKSIVEQGNKLNTELEKADNSWVDILLQIQGSIIGPMLFLL